MAGDGLERLIRFAQNVWHINNEAARLAEPRLQAAITSLATRGVSPYGEVWLPKKDGSRALKGAGNRIDSSVKGSRVILGIWPPYAYHNGGVMSAADYVRKKRREAAKKAGKSASKEDLKVVGKRAGWVPQGPKKKKQKGVQSNPRSKFHSPRRQILPYVYDVPAEIWKIAHDAAREAWSKHTSKLGRGGRG